MLLALSRAPETEDLAGGQADWSLESALTTLERAFPDLPSLIQGKHVLDFGCGGGWQTMALSRAGALHVCGVDTNHRVLERARERAARAGFDSAAIGFVDHVGALQRKTFDVVISQNAMEHFRDPQAALRAMTEAARPGGRVLISFGPPWMAPYGSHMQFFTKVPWVNLLFPERTVMAVRRRFRDDGATRYEEVEGGLNRMTLQRFEELLEESGQTPETLHYECVKGIDALRHLPFMRELFVNHVNCILRVSE